MNAFLAAGTDSISGAVEQLLRAHGIPRDGVLFVHSSFRGLARKGIQPEALLEGMLGYLDRGTLLLPAMSWRSVNPDQPVFDEVETPSITGVLSEIFRSRYAVQRSLHPTHSVAGRGPAADYVLGEHHLDETPCGDRSPVGRLAASGGHVLLLGVEMDSCTLVHHAEEKVAPELYLRLEVELYRCRRRDGSEVQVRTRRHRRLARNFWQFEDMLAERGLVHQSRLEETLCRSFPAREMDQLIKEVLRRTPDGTIARPGQRFKMM